MATKYLLESRISETLESYAESRNPIQIDYPEDLEVYDSGALYLMKLLSFTADPDEKNEFLFNMPKAYIKRFEMKNYSKRKDRQVKKLAREINSGFREYRKEFKNMPTFGPRRAILKIFGQEEKKPDLEDMNINTDKRADMIIDYLLLMRKEIYDNPRRDIDETKNAVRIFDNSVMDVMTKYESAGQSIRIIESLKDKYSTMAKIANAKWYRHW